MQKFEEFIGQNDYALAVELGEAEVDQVKKLDPTHKEETKEEYSWQLSEADYNYANRTIEPLIAISITVYGFPDQAEAA